MSIDIPTLFLVSTFVTSLLGIFLLVLWIQDRSARALGYWAAAYLIGGAAVALWLVMPEQLPGSRFDIASALLFLCCGLIWSGARTFHGRTTMPITAATGSFVWLIASQIPEIIESDSARVIVSSIIIATYAVLTAGELQRERRNPKSRTRLFVIPVLHGVIFLSPILTTTLFAGEPMEHVGWLPLFTLLMLLYVVGTAFIVMVMTKEHSVQLHKTAAMTDPMTGLFNRRGFAEAAEKLIAAQSKSGQPVTVMMFDLDHFKSINDRFGHDVGDDALKAFAETASSSMRTNDVIGRLGGEEFAAIIPGGGETALIVGERVRAAFEVRGIEISGRTLNATVSIGAIEALAENADVSAMLTRADEALYAAKKLGRNRVCTEKDIVEQEPEAKNLPQIALFRPTLKIPNVPFPAMP
jgi:diguanylate cyclase (GGDEF)-like protein